MGTALLELWEALGESLGVLIVGLLYCVMFWAWRRDFQRRENDSKAFWARVDSEREAREKQAERDREESREQDERERAEYKEQADREPKAFEAWDERIRAESKERIDRIRAESKERIDRIRAESKERIDRIRAESKERIDRIRTESKEQYECAYARLATAVAALQGDVKVLLDRSNRSSGGEPSGQPSPFDGVAHQALPDQCEDDAKTSSDEPVAPPPSASAAEDPAD